MKKLEAEYRGAILGLELDDGEVRLLINGLTRQRGELTSTVRLSSVVQTDYEFHEFIEAVVSRTEDAVKATLFAGSSEVASREFPR